MKNGKRQQKKRSNAMNLAMIRSPKASTPNEVVVRMRLGYTTGAGAGAGAVTFQVNNPLSIIPNWSARSVDFMAYRVVALMASVQPLDPTTVGTVTLPNIGKVYASALVTAANTFSPPTTFPNVLEYPSADIRPFNSNNPLSRRKFHWKTKDINALIFNGIAVAPLAEGVHLCVCTNSAATTASYEVSGWMDIEFRGLATV